MLDKYHEFNRWLDANFDITPILAWMNDHIEFPIFAITLYLVMVFWGQEYMKERKAWNLKPLFIVWNLFLSLLSIAGAMYCVPWLINLVFNTPDGWLMSICNPSFREGGYYYGAAGFWSAVFTFSKFPELMDTFFLVFQKKPVIFLHWYHHITVLLYCWHGLIVGISVGFWFMGMNFFIHSIMYTYYFLMSLSSTTRSLVKPFAMLITSLQILQMVAGLVFVGFQLYYALTIPKCTEVTHFGNSKLCVGMYFSYFVLFGQLYINAYIRKKPKKV